MNSHINKLVGWSIDEVERELILATLARVNGGQKAAAKVLGVSLKTLYNKLRRYRLEGEMAEDEARAA